MKKPPGGKKTAPAGKSAHIEKIVGRILKKRKKTLTVAESCTGGGIGKAITDPAGSSEYFIGGMIAYSNEAKIKHLGVRKSTIQKHGAVSEQTAIAMAKGARKKFGADYALSATGIAGPGGGTKEKPVGLIYIAVSGPKGGVCRRLDLTAGRKANRQRTVSEALLLLYECLTKDALASTGKSIRKVR